MATQEKQQTKKTNIKEFMLSTGEKLELDLNKLNGHLLVKCRNAAGAWGTVIQIISEIGTFDGHKIPAPELLDRSGFFIVELEQVWAEVEASEKKSI